MRLRQRIRLSLGVGLCGLKARLSRLQLLGRLRLLDFGLGDPVGACLFKSALQIPYASLGLFQSLFGDL